MADQTPPLLVECPHCGTMTPSWSDCAYCGGSIAASAQAAAPLEHARTGFDLDQLGDWSEIKHQILSEYAPAYTRILSAQPFIRRVLYVDGFAGAGVAVDRDTGETLKGSATRMAEVVPPFQELHFIELVPGKAQRLRAAFAHDPRVHVHEGDCNQLLLSEILPRCAYNKFARALVLLDPYGLSVDWAVLEALAREKSIEIFFNFMIVDANRNVLWRDPSRVSASQKARMSRIWPGDWESELYRQQETLFEPVAEKVSNSEVAELYRAKLRDVAGFKFVPEPIPMKNSRNATIYYLFFAGHNPTGAKIAAEIFAKFRRASRSIDGRQG